MIAPCCFQNLLQTHKLVSQFWHNRQRKCHHFPVSHAKRLCFVISPEGTFGTNHLHHRDHTTQGFPEHHTTTPGDQPQLPGEAQTCVLTTTPGRRPRPRTEAPGSSNVRGFISRPRVMQPDTLGGLLSPPGRTQHYRPGAEFPKQLEKRKTLVSLFLVNF